MLQPGIMLNDRYEIIKKIGSGGMSDVYQAKCCKLNRSVAIKVLKEEFRIDDNFVSKFKVEAQSAASLSHHNIVNVYDVGYDSNIYYIVMEYVEGITLKELIQERGSITPEETIHLAIQIASGIEHAHKNHIIHRDIKPQNIIISKGGIAKVTDFGIARAANSSTISAVNVMGSVHYLSPEQARGGYVDEKSDIYSLGITMYEMVTGKVPFEGENNVSVALLHIQEEIEKPSILKPETPQSLEDIILKSTQKKSELRYDDMSELISDLNKSIDSPEGDFVKINDNSNAHTIYISDDDVKKIRKASKSKDELEEKNKLFNFSNPLVEKLIISSGVILALIIVGVITFASIQFFRDKFEPNDVEVPKLVGMTEEDASKELSEINLVLDPVRHEYNNEYEKGVIINQLPEEDTIVNEESKINVVISNGVQKFKVPDVTNIRFNIAEKTLIDENLTVERELEYSDVVPMGVVIRQYPKKGEELDKGDTVVIVVSNGKRRELTTVPSLKGLKEEEVEQKLKENDLELGNITYVESEQYEKGQVISQTVQPGEEVEIDYIIDIAVSKGYTKYVEEVIVLEDILEEDGQEKAIIRLDLIQEDTETTVYEKVVEESEFPLSVLIEGEEGTTGTVQLYINDEKQDSEWSITFSEED